MMTSHLRGLVAASTLAIALACALPFAAIGLAPRAVAAQESGIELGAKGPDAVLETLDGKPATLASAIAGRPALIEFWATWCSNCRDLEPTLAAAQAKFGAQVAFIGVAVSVNQSTERVRRYTEEHLLGFTHLYDRRGNAVVAYDVPATSYIVVLDRTGTVVYTGVGVNQDIEGAIRKALK